MFLVRKLKLNPIQAVNYTSNTKDTKAVCVQNDEAESIYDFPGVSLLDNETWSKVEEKPIARTNFEEHSTVNETDKCLLLNPNQGDGFNFIGHFKNEKTNFEEHPTGNETDKCLLLNPNQGDGFNFIDSSMFSEDLYNLKDSEALQKGDVNNTTDHRDGQLQETIIEINLGLSDFMFENFQDMPEIK